MYVFVNDRCVTVFSGARASHALIKYFRVLRIKKDLDTLVLTDQWGNKIAQDSPLTDNEHIYFSEPSKD